MADYGQPKTLADNQKLQPGCPWDNPFYFPNSDTGVKYAYVMPSVKTCHMVKIWNFEF